MTRLQRLRERALALPIAVFLLLSPPLLTLFGQHVKILGLPLLFLYVFTVWSLAIVLGFLLSRALNQAGERPPAQPGPGKGRDRDRGGDGLEAVG
jgi:hypothetical protein